MASRALLVSGSPPLTPARQQQIERRLLGSAALGEMHLHHSSLAGDVVALGAFEPEPSLASAATPAGAPAIWRRTTGGRAVGCGTDAAILTVALPHRSALVGDDPGALKPEQVMNRAVRGVLAALRKLALDPIYPGLDAITVARRPIAHVSFAENADGPCLFQAIVARERAIALAPDASGAPEPTSLAEQLAVRRRDAAVDPARLARELPALVAEGYAATFGLEPFGLDPEVVAAMMDTPLADDAQRAPGIAPAAPPPEAGVATGAGRLGPLTAWAIASGGRVAAVGLAGAFLARDGTIAALAEAVAGCDASASAVSARVSGVLDGRERYVLGATVDELAALIARAAVASPAGTTQGVATPRTPPVR
ncbi:MAG TPA: hypothetical protein VFD92_04005 [Candidatus Binatia bacterium]|nr:hypothetical protein [Candidatus Binatia bacterium]